MPDSKATLLKVLSETKTTLQAPTQSFQIACLDKFIGMINAIPVDKVTEMDLRICGFLLDKCLCDLDARLGSEHTILNLIKKGGFAVDEFCVKVNKVLEDEVTNLKKYSSNSFFDQSFKMISAFLIGMKSEVGQLKTAFDQRRSDASTLSFAEHTAKYSGSV